MEPGDKITVQIPNTTREKVFMVISSGSRAVVLSGYVSGGHYWTQCFVMAKEDLIPIIKKIDPLGSDTNKPVLPTTSRFEQGYY